CHPAVRLVEFEELGRPHLMLPHLGRYVDVASPGQRVEPLYRILRLCSIPPVLFVGQAGAGAPALDPPPPPPSRGGVAGGPSRPSWRGGWAGQRRAAGRGAGTADRASPTSPMIGRSTWTFLFIEDGSMSM